MRGYLSAGDNQKENYLDIFFNAYWRDNLDLSSEQEFSKLLVTLGIDTKIFFEKIKQQSIKDELKKNKLQDKLGEILVPTHQVTEVKKGKRTKKEKKYFPGYVLVRVELTKQIYHLIKNLQKVSGFLGSADKPTPISDNEIKRILGQVSESAVNQKSGISFEIGEKVKVCDGPFASFNGLIEEIDEEKSRLKVSVSIFGRATPVDLEFNQVEKN